jgi:hypothetical protein
MRLSSLLVPLLACLALAAPARAGDECKHAGPNGCNHGSGEAGKEGHKDGRKEDAKASKADARPAGWTLTRGEKPTGAPAVTLAKLLEDPAAHKGQVRTVEGTVRQACTRKGCWMELATSEGAKGPGMRVTFKDYAFFVPTDSAGLQARVEGVVGVEELPEAQAKHYESEGAKIFRGADGKAREVQLVASAVELRK